VNSPSAAAHGDQFTDALASWVKQGYVAGPFHAPPTNDFRANTMLAIEQKGKVRIVMDLSQPDGESFNDAVDEDAIEKVHMSTARLFGHAVIDCGRGARMWKYDFTDAYKNIPAHPSDWRLQGFRWLGKYFVETQQVFGSKAAVAAFDGLGHTLADIAISKSKIPPHAVHRTLDDVLVVTPADSDVGPAFASHYKNLCASVGAGLAPLCARNDKAFEDQTVGTALGVVFDTTALTWTITPTPPGHAGTNGQAQRLLSNGPLPKSFQIRPHQSSPTPVGPPHGNARPSVGGDRRPESLESRYNRL